jgi:hypothetical protein
MNKNIENLEPKTLIQLIYAANKTELRFPFEALKSERFEFETTDDTLKIIQFELLQIDQQFILIEKTIDNRENLQTVEVYNDEAEAAEQFAQLVKDYEACLIEAAMPDYGRE